MVFSHGTRKRPRNQIAVSTIPEKIFGTVKKRKTGSPIMEACLLSTLVVPEWPRLWRQFTSIPDLKLFISDSQPEQKFRNNKKQIQKNEEKEEEEERGERRGGEGKWTFFRLAWTAPPSDLWLQVTPYGIDPFHCHHYSCCCPSLPYGTGSGMVPIKT